ncbi:MAG: FAD-dependent oxidoreductase, partial [Burkholderiaceae bacterium]|nr:FAD-dependent oxidoreductase [Burkholderiaceae bacterium]
MSSAPQALDAQTFLRGNGLPERWRARERFVVLQTSFGCGHGFLAAWDAWRKDPKRCQRLHFIALAKRPPTRNELAQAQADSAVPALAQQLLQAWPPLTPNIHSLRFDAGQVELLLVLTHSVDPVAEIVATVDAFYVHASDRDTKLPPQPSRSFKAIARLAAPQATLACAGSWPTLHQDLRSAGFQVHALEKQLTLATYAPHFTPTRAPARVAAAACSERHALIVGAGLAGCATAWALAEQGWHSTVLDRLPHIAQAASGNVAGLFHGVVNPQDGLHARFNRAAALAAQRAVGIALAQHGVAGQLAGVLRSENSYPLAQMQRQLAALKLPTGYVQALTTDSASALSGLPLQGPAWYYPGGGWVQPAGLAMSF